MTSVFARQNTVSPFSSQICEFYRFCRCWHSNDSNNEASFIEYNNFLLLFTELRSSENCVDELKPVRKLRSESNNATDFDKSLDKLINLFTTQPHQDYPDSKLIHSNCQTFFADFYSPSCKQSTRFGRNSRECLRRLRECYCMSRSTELFIDSCSRRCTRIM